MQVVTRSSSELGERQARLLKVEYASKWLREGEKLHAIIAVKPKPGKA